MNNKLGIVLLILMSCSVLTADSDNLVSKYLKKFYSEQNIVIPTDSQKKVKTVWALGQRVVSTISGKATEMVNWIFIWDMNTAIIFSKNGKLPVNLFLKRGADIWLYKQGLRVPLRISISYQLNNQVNLFDVLQVPINNYKVLSSSETSERLQAELTTNIPGLPYPQIRLDFDKATGDLMRAVYKGSSGKSIKEVNFTDYTTLKGQHRFPRWKIHNLLFNNQDTATIVYFNVKPYTLKLSDFNPQRNSLEQFLERFSNLVRQK